MANPLDALNKKLEQNNQVKQAPPKTDSKAPEPKKEVIKKVEPELKKEVPKKENKPAPVPEISKKEPVSLERTNTERKTGAGRPKIRREEDKQISFWLEGDLYKMITKQLKYGDSLSNFINQALREYLTDK